MKSFESSGSSVPNLTYPGDRCLTVYVERDFNGDTKTICLPDGETEHKFEDDFFKEISSFEAGKNVRYEFGNYFASGTGYDLLTGAGHVRSGRIQKWMEDNTKYITLRYYDSWTQGSANIWGWTGCTDTAAELQGPSSIYDAAITYTDDEAWTHGMGIAEVESVQVPMGYELVIYETESLQGENYYVVKGTQNTDDNEFIDCVDLPEEWRDRGKSYEVRKTQEIGKAKV